MPRGVLRKTREEEEGLLRHCSQVAHERELALEYRQPLPLGWLCGVLGSTFFGGRGGGCSHSERSTATSLGAVHTITLLPSLPSTPSQPRAPARPRLSPQSLSLRSLRYLVACLHPFEMQLQLAHHRVVNQGHLFVAVPGNG
jgi:hypothetical protein